MKKVRPRLSSKREDIMAIEQAINGREKCSGWTRDYLAKIAVIKLEKKNGERYPGKMNSYEVHTSWECRDCAALDDLGYFDKCHELSRSKRRSGTKDGFRQSRDSAIPNKKNKEGE